MWRKGPSSFTVWAEAGMEAGTRAGGLGGEGGGFREEEWRLQRVPEVKVKDGCGTGPGP